MPGQEETTVFISYSRTDSDFVDRLEADLKARGFGTWVDRLNLEPGEEWPDVIQRQVERCDAMVVVLSQEAVESSWVKKEYHHALALGRPIIPAQLEPVPRILALDTIQRADFQADYQVGLRTVLVALAQVGHPGQQPAQRDIRAGSDDLSGPPQPAQEPQQLSADDLYSRWAPALANHDLDLADILGEQIQALDPDGLGPIVAGQLKPIEPELHEIRLKRLRSQADQARAAGEWGQEAGAWQALLALEPNDEQALVRLPIAQHNRQPQYTKLYNVIKGLSEAGNAQAVKQQLQVLWSEAPYYGDPAGIAAKVGMSVPLTPEEEQEARIYAEEIKRQQEILEQQTLENKQKEIDRKRKEEIARQQAEILKNQEDAKARKQLEKAWKAYNSRREAYCERVLHADVYLAVLCALATVIVLATTLFDIINANLNTRGWFAGLIAQGPLADLYQRGLLRYIAYGVALIAVALIIYGVGYWRVLDWRVMAALAVLGGIAAYGLALLPISLLSQQVRFYTFPFEGTLRLSSVGPGSFCLAFGMSYVILMLIPAIITVFVGSLVDDFGFGGGLAAAGGELLGSFVIGFLLAIPVGFFGWGWGGLICGGLVGIVLALLGVFGTLGRDGLPIGVALAVGIAALIGLLTWPLFAWVLRLDSAIILLWSSSIVAGLIGGAAVMATLRVWFTRAHHAPKPKEGLPVAA
jgi:hypothetical protein